MEKSTGISRIFLLPPGIKPSVQQSGLAGRKKSGDRRTGPRQGLLSVFDRLHDAPGQAGQALDFAGNDDLRGFPICHLLHRLQGLELDDLVVGAGLVQDLDRVGQCLLDGQDGLGLALGASWSSLLLVL